MRTRFIETVTQMAEIDSRIMLLVGDLGFSVVEDFAARYPAQFINVGVAEQNMTSVAAGLAMAGRSVFTYSIANFPTMRCLEQIRVDVCYHKLNVKIVAVGCGFSYGAHGYTHHGLEDIAIMRALPHMRVFAPAGPEECEAAIREMVQTPGPAYLRLGRNGEPSFHEKIPSVGSPQTLREGTDVLFLSTGTIAGEALKAAEALAGHNVSASVVSVPQLKPFPRDQIAALAQRWDTLITVEEHSGIGGLGSATAEVLAEMSHGARLVRCHTREEVTAVGSQHYLRHLSGLSAAALTHRALDTL